MAKNYAGKRIFEQQRVNKIIIYTAFLFYNGAVKIIAMMQSLGLVSFSAKEKARVYATRLNDTDVLIALE